MIAMAGRIENMGGAASQAVVDRLEAGESWNGVARSSSLEPADLIAAVAARGLGLEGSEGLKLVQGGSKHPQLAPALAEPALSSLFPGASRPSRLALSAGLFQVLDHWDASHEAAQEADDLGERVGSTYWHMIAHRREPDAGNAYYWSRRVGRHAILEGLAIDARPLLDAHGDPALRNRLIVNGAFNSSSMIDLAEEARTGSPLESLARRLQRLEMIYLLGAVVAAVQGSR